MSEEKSKTNYIKMARASEEELDALLEFESELEALVDGCSDQEELGEWLHTYVVKHGNRQRILYQYGLPFSISRIVWGYKTMFDNACDPEAEAIEWKPEILQLFQLPEQNTKALALLWRVYRWAQIPPTMSGGNFDVFAEQIVPDIAAFLEGGETAVSPEEPTP